MENNSPFDLQEICLVFAVGSSFFSRSITAVLIGINGFWSNNGCFKNA